MGKASRQSFQDLPLMRNLQVDGDGRLFRFLGTFAPLGAACMAYAMSLEFVVPPDVEPPPRLIGPPGRWIPPPGYFQTAPKPPPRQAAAKPGKRPGAAAQARGRGNPDAERGVARIREITSRNPSSSLNAFEVLPRELVRDMDKALESVTGLSRTGNSRFSGRRGKQEADWNGVYSAGGGEGLGNALEDLWAPAGGSLPTSLRGDKTLEPVGVTLDMTAEGSLRSSQSILQVVRRHMPGLRHLYNRHLKLHPGLQGKITLEFSIAPSGAVLGLRVLSGSTGEPGFDAEVLAHVRAWRFEPIRAAGNDVVTLPFTFSE